MNQGCKNGAKVLFSCNNFRHLLLSRADIKASLILMLLQKSNNNQTNKCTNSPQLSVINGVADSYLGRRKWYHPMFNILRWNHLPMAKLNWLVSSVPNHEKIKQLQSLNFWEWTFGSFSQWFRCLILTLDLVLMSLMLKETGKWSSMAHLVGHRRW